MLLSNEKRKIIPFQLNIFIFAFSNINAEFKLAIILQKLKCYTFNCRKKIKTTRIGSMMEENGSVLLQLLCEYYFTATDDITMAKFAAFWSLHKTLKAQRRIEHVAKCFTTALKICMVTNTHVLLLVRIALHEILLSSSIYSIEKESLDEIIKLYAVIMESL